MITGTNWQELDYGQAEGGRLRVRLLWNQRSHNLAVDVNDRGVERVLAVRDPSAARERLHAPVRVHRIMSIGVPKRLTRRSRSPSQQRWHPMTDERGHSNQPLATRARIETWETAFADDSGARCSAMAAPGLALEGRKFQETINGRDSVFRAMGLSARLCDRLEFVHEAVLPDRTDMEWEASAFGLAISGVTVLIIDSGGWLVRIPVHHRPLGAVERFFAEFRGWLPRA